MNRLVPDEVEALRTLARAWPAAKTVVLGAAAIRSFLPMHWRVTQDLDLTVASSIEEVTASLSILPGWSRDPRQEQRWFTPKGIAVDCIPAGPAALTRGHIEWPKSGFRMSLLGMRLAFEHAVAFRVASDLDVHVAPLRVVTVLKMVAYQERPDVREKDVGDLAHIMHGYVPAESDRRYSSEVPDDLTEFEDVAPYLLGRDVGAIVNPEERRVVSAFIASMEDGTRGPRLAARMAILGPVAWRHPDAVFERVSAFGRGLSDDR